jgi:uncharacterized protein
MEITAYRSPSLLFNSHLQTIYPSLLRKISVAYLRERIPTPDHDFLDVDWLTKQSRKLVIISHGLEGNSKRPYVAGMANYFFNNGFDVLAWNYRGCSEEMNQQLRFYHSGATDDLDTIVEHAVQKGYDHINLLGFSLGGNLTLKYAGEQSEKINSKIKKAVAFSVPLNLHSSCIALSKPSNWIYAQRFLKSLKKKIIDKAKQKTEIDISPLSKIKTRIDFDDHYTAPLHGFENAIDYYKKCSSLYFLNNIKIPTLVVNAANDPFLNQDCFPIKQLKDHEHVRLEIPNQGGHCGFALFNQNGVYWSEQRALAFIQND